MHAMPKSGRGEYLKIAKHLAIHTSTLSQVLSGLKHFTLDQACSHADQKNTTPIPLANLTKSIFVRFL
jgi:hypothetical protein